MAGKKTFTTRRFSRSSQTNLKWPTYWFHTYEKHFSFTIGVLSSFSLSLFWSYHFLLIAANKAFETGRDTAFLDDYVYFDNREVKAAKKHNLGPSTVNTIHLSFLKK